jgi:hypothetical protein
MPWQSDHRWRFPVLAPGAALDGGNGMKALAMISCLLFMTSVAFAQQKPIAYNNLSPGGRTPLDQAAHDALDGKYDVIDFELAKHDYKPPHPVAGSMPGTPKDSAGAPVHGYVMLAYVITFDGRAASPTIVKCTAAALCVAAIDATRGWRFDVATLDGRKVSTIALQEFNF